MRKQILIGAVIFAAGVALGMGIALVLALHILQMDATYPAVAPWIVWA